MLVVKKIAQLTGHNASVFTLSKGKSKQHFLSGSGDGWIVEWSRDNLDFGKLIARVETNVFSLLILSVKDRIVAGNMNGGLHWIDAATTDNTKNVQHHEKGLFAFLEIGEHLYSAGGDGVFTKWSIKNKRTVESYQLTSQSLRCLAYAPNRNEIAIGASNNSIYFLEATTLELKKELKNAHDNSVFSIAYANDEKYLFSGGRDAYLRIWDLENDYKNVSSQPAHLYTINNIKVSPNGKLFATGSRDKTIKIWNAEDYKLLKVLDTARDGGHVNSVNALLWLDENTLVSGSDDRSLIVWHVTS